jgi:hypothetical protein
MWLENSNCCAARIARRDLSNARKSGQHSQDKDC